MSEYAQVSKPSLWCRLGFHYKNRMDLYDWRDTPEPGFCESAMSTVTDIRVDLFDRLRLLISGHCQITVYTKTDVLVQKMESRSQFAVLPPA